MKKSMVLVCLLLSLVKAAKAQEQCDQVNVQLSPNTQCFMNYAKSECHFHNLQIACGIKEPNGKCKQVVSFIDQNCVQSLAADKLLVECLNKYSNPLYEKLHRLCESKVFSCRIN